METPPKRPFIPSVEQWVAHLNGLIARPLEVVPIDGTDEQKFVYIEGFRDEFGSRRSTDRALLSRVLGVEYQCVHSEKCDLDHRLWEAVHGIGGEWGSFVSETGGLVEPTGYAIEHRTLIELSALHALWHLFAGGAGEPMRERVDALVDWHTRELQPDNGINRPWGVHVFVMRSIEADDEQIQLDAMLHAQTLVNNCCISLGKPDVLSAMILLDAANALRELI